MVAGIGGFNRTWLSCKKKYKAILKDYRNDKRANEIQARIGNKTVGGLMRWTYGTAAVLV